MTSTCILSPTFPKPPIKNFSCQNCFRFKIFEIETIKKNIKVDLVYSIE